MTRSVIRPNDGDLRHGTRHGYINLACRCQRCRDAILIYRRQKQLAAGDPRHGTTNGYTNFTCRCQRCRDAWAEECAARKERRNLPADDPRHGRYTTYGNYKCRCARCVEAWNTYYRDLSATQGTRAQRRAKVGAA